MKLEDVTAQLRPRGSWEAVDLGFALTRRHFPLLLDLTNPSPAIGWAHRERPSLADRGPADTLLALGLIHHLAIANNLPLAHIVSYLKTLARRVE